MYRVTCSPTKFVTVNGSREYADVLAVFFRLQYPDALVEQATIAVDFDGNEYVACWTPVLEVRQ